MRYLMTNIEVILEISKVLSPIITVGLAAFLAARYYFDGLSN